MTIWKRYTVALLGITVLSGLCLGPADAKPNKGKKGEQTTPTQPVTPSAKQSPTVDQAAGQGSFLPPGIQKQIARGKKLPPGIAKK